ncbi:MAG TPA: hypothetical protein VIJ86_11895 [Acidimicrobiales bacterium]
MNQTQISSSARCDATSLTPAATAIDTRRCVARHDDTPVIDARRSDDAATSRVVELVERALHALQVMSA